MSLDPATNSLAVTGGEDDKAFVWRVSDGEVLLECTGECEDRILWFWQRQTAGSFCCSSSGHKDSVTCAMFSHDSSLVASGDMSGLIKVWKVETKEEIWSFEVEDLEVSGFWWFWVVAEEAASPSSWSRSVAGLASLRSGADGGNRRRQRVDVEGPGGRLQDLPESGVSGHDREDPPRR